MSCKDCVFCKTALISDYVKGAEFYKCDMDNDVILDPYKEGENCTWFRGYRTQKTSLKERIVRRLRRWGS